MANILIIDDEAALRQALRVSLEQAGHEVTEAADGAEVDPGAPALDYDIALLDLFMPEQEGLETLAALRAARPDRPIIAMSGGGKLGLMGALKSAMQLGAAASLSKPFAPDELLALIDQLLETSDA